MSTLDSNIVQLQDATLSREQILAKIAQLEVTDEGEPLRGAMDDLKAALKANPAACAAMLPEDIGLMVKHLMRLTGKEIEDTMAGKKSARKPKVDLKNLTAEQQQDIANDLF